MCEEQKRKRKKKEEVKGARCFSFYELKRGNALSIIGEKIDNSSDPKAVPTHTYKMSRSVHLCLCFVLRSYHFRARLQNDVRAAEY